MRHPSATNRAPARQLINAEGNGGLEPARPTGAVVGRGGLPAVATALQAGSPRRHTCGIHRTHSSLPNAFTLVELLTVIAIIAILAGLLFPTIKTAMLKAEKAKAQTAIAGLATAFKAYYTEYGQWPTAVAGAMYITTNLFSNPRNIVFYEFPAKDIDSAGTYGAAPSVAYLDPWKKPYRVSFDTLYQNSVQNPFPSGTPNPINLGVIVWSCGPDGSCSDILPAVGGGGGPAASDNDNATNW